MTIGSILLGLALLLLVLLFLARPFLAQSPRLRRTTRREALLSQKEVLLDQIKALDFDSETGKVPDDVYQRQREQMLAEASAVLHEIDELDSHIVPDSDAQKASDDVDAEIEAAIARFRHASPPHSLANGKSRFCTQCGQPADPDDRFCARCGHELGFKQSA